MDGPILGRDADISHPSVWAPTHSHSALGAVARGWFLLELSFLWYHALIFLWRFVENVLWNAKISAPGYLISPNLERWRLTVSLATPAAVLLPQFTDLDSWGCPIFIKNDRNISFPDLETMRLCNSTSAAEHTTIFKIHVATCMLPFILFGLTFPRCLLANNNPPICF